MPDLQPYACPACLRRSLQHTYPAPPDYLAGMDLREWLDDPRNQQPNGVECVECGWRGE